MKRNTPPFTEPPPSSMASTTTSQSNWTSSSSSTSTPDYPPPLKYPRPVSCSPQDAATVHALLQQTLLIGQSPRHPHHHGVTSSSRSSHQYADIPPPPAHHRPKPVYNATWSPHNAPPPISGSCTPQPAHHARQPPTISTTPTDATAITHCGHPGTGVAMPSAAVAQTLVTAVGSTGATGLNSPHQFSASVDDGVQQVPNNVASIHAVQKTYAMVPLSARPKSYPYMNAAFSPRQLNSTSTVGAGVSYAANNAMVDHQPSSQPYNMRNSGRKAHSTTVTQQQPSSQSFNNQIISGRGSGESQGIQQPMFQTAGGLFLYGSVLGALQNANHNASASSGDHRYHHHYEGSGRPLPTAAQNFLLTYVPCVPCSAGFARRDPEAGMYPCMPYIAPKRPETLSEAACMYIDYLVQENENLTHISHCECQHTFTPGQQDTFLNDVLRGPCQMPTDKFRAWLKQFNVEIEVVTGHPPPEEPAAVGAAPSEDIAAADDEHNAEDDADQEDLEHFETLFVSDDVSIGSGAGMDKVGESSSPALTHNLS